VTGEDGVTRCAGRQLDGLRRGSGGHGGIARKGVVVVHEVGVPTLRQVAERGDAARDVEPVPPHVGDLVLRSRREAYDAGGENAETGDRPELLALLEQELHAEAAAEERAPGGDG